MKFILEPYNRNVSKDDLLKDLKKVSKFLKKETISHKEYSEHGKYGRSTYMAKFGSWKNALKEAGLNRSKNWGTTGEDYFKNLEEVWIRLGRQPYHREMQIPFSKLSGTAYLHKFGTWRNALEEFVNYINNEGQFFTEDSIKKVRPERITKHKTKRDINWRLRFLVMQRDNFKCKHCGRTPASDPKIVLHVDHVKAWVNGGETVLENLQNLCSKCNIGKSNL
jgi:hypothetical protein